MFPASRGVLNSVFSVRGLSQEAVSSRQVTTTAFPVDCRYRLPSELRGRTEISSNQAITSGSILLSQTAALI
jgi:hypothetical protein